MKYCTHCILPDTRPNLSIMADGRCNACHSWHEKKSSIDWLAREKNFSKLVKSIKKKSAPWDCVIPVSGGKDSTWQVIKALEYGLKPLCVTWRTPVRNALGQKNLDNLIQLGVEHIDFSINPKVEKKFMLTSFEKLGTLAIPMHMALFAIPLRVAINYKIPLVLWGENSGIEYGGNNKHLLGATMNQEWLKNYGVTQGTTAFDWIDENLTKQDLYPYQWPTDAELNTHATQVCFLGWYFSWDPTHTYHIASQHGFQASSEPTETGYYQFADIDDEFIISIHHWIKWYKFGFTRLWDNLALEIRNQRMTRQDALDIIIQKENDYPKQAIQKFCQWANYSKQDFDTIIEKFRNKSIWKMENGSWKIQNFLIPHWQWT